MAAEKTPEKTKLEQELSNRGYITASEAAERMQVSVYTIYRKITAGRLEGARVTGHWFVKESSINKAAETDSDQVGLKLLADIRRAQK